MTGATDLIVTKLSESGKKVTPTGSNTWKALCPAHEDKNPSLSIRQGTGQVLMFCHAGCAINDVVTALGLTTRDLFDNKKGVDYNYRHEGRNVRKVHRTHDKQFTQSGIEEGVNVLYNPGEASFQGAKVYLPEGEKDVDTLVSVGVIAVTSPMGAATWAQCDYEPLKVAEEVIIVADKDQAGEDRAHALQAHLTKLEIPCRIVQAKSGKDSSDHLTAGHTVEEFLPMPERKPEPATKTASKLITITAENLAAKVFPEVQWLVEGIWPSGYTNLAGAPKSGKSFMALQLAGAVSTGGLMFGHIPTGDPRPVLYLALEDGYRRLQSRMAMTGIETNGLLSFATSLNKQPVMESIAGWLEGYKDDAPLVILDTLGRAFADSPSKASQFSQEYEVGGGLQDLVKDIDNAALVALHHTRKDTSSMDWMDAVSGTNAIAGAADTVMVLQRERASNRATLHLTSRDVKEHDYSILFSESCVWNLEGNTVAEAIQSAAKAKMLSGVGEVMQRVIDVIAEFSPDGTTPGNVKALLPDDAKNVDMYIKRAFDAGKIEKKERGVYVIAGLDETSVRSVSSLVSDTELTNSHNSHSSGGGNPWAV